MGAGAFPSCSADSQEHPPIPAHLGYQRPPGQWVGGPVPCADSRMRRNTLRQALMTHLVLHCTC